MLPKSRSREFSRFAGGQERELSSCRIDLTASRPIQPRAAPLLRRAPPRPDPPVVCPGFGFDRCQLLNRRVVCLCKLVEPKTQTNLERVVSRDACRGGQPGRTGSRFIMVAQGTTIPLFSRSTEHCLVHLTMPCVKSFYRDNRASFHWSATRNE